MRDGLRDDFVLADHEPAALHDWYCHAASPVVSGAAFFFRVRGAVLLGGLTLPGPPPRGRSASTASQRPTISGSLSRSALARNCFTSGVCSASIRSLVQSIDRGGLTMVAMVDFTFRSESDRRY